MGASTGGRLDEGNPSQTSARVGRLFFSLHPFGDGKDDAFVPVFPQDGPCVDVIVQVPVVKGDQQDRGGSGAPFSESPPASSRPCPAPAVFGHASALVFKMFRADGDGPRKGGWT